VAFGASSQNLTDNRNLSTVKKNEMPMISQQGIANRQRGLNPISPQSSNFDCALSLPAQEPASHSKRQDQAHESLDREVRKCRSGVDTSTSKASRTSKALAKRNSKQNQGAKDPNLQPNGIFRHSNSVSSLKSVKSLRSINSLKSGAAAAGGLTNSVSKKGRKEGSSNKQRI
jgi:hypothetical protein